MKKQDVTARLGHLESVTTSPDCCCAEKGSLSTGRKEKGDCSPWEQPRWVLTWAWEDPSPQLAPKSLVAVRTGPFHSNKLRFWLFLTSVTFPAPSAALLLTASCTRAQLLSCVRFFMTPWSVALQAPLAMAISQARILEWFAISFSTDLPDPEIEPALPEMAGGFLTTVPPHYSLLTITFVLVYKISTLTLLYTCELPMTSKCSAIETLFQANKNPNIIGTLPWIFSRQKIYAGRATSFFGLYSEPPSSPLLQNLMPLSTLRSRTKQRRSFRGLWTFIFKESCTRLSPGATSAPLASPGL